MVNQQRKIPNKTQLKLLGIPLVIGMVVSLTAVSSARATETDEHVQLKLTGSAYSVLSERGEAIKLVPVQDTAAEDLSVGYSKTTGAMYVRTVNNFSGAKEEPLFDENSKPTPGEPELADVDGDLQTQEFLALADLPQVNPAELKLGTVIAVNSTSATLAWNVPTGAESVMVLLNGNPVKSNASGVTLDGLAADTTYEITVGFSAGTGKERQSIREDLHVIHTLPVDIGNPVANKSVATKVTTFAAWSQAKAVRLVTFLGGNYYSAGWMGAVGCGTPASWYFKGDNRGYSAPVGPTSVHTHASHRTGFEVIADLDAPPAYQGVYVYKSIGKTYRYDASLNYVDWLIASDNGMVIQNPTVSANNYVKYGVSHEVGDPYCWIGKIRYSLPLVEVYKSGTISMSGSRQPVPTFEFYASFVSSTGSSYWATMYLGTEGDLFCLLGTCPSQNISRTHTTW